ncbi:four helix bundle protein [Patescibacteria group bacterium]|nr:four helix bundle protein [Patescibacteria group bacterium]
MTQFSNKYDLEDRTAKFAEEIIRLVKSIKITSINKRIIEQIVGSGGSIGANYCEANEAESKQDFKHKVGICKKEIKETKHWLRLLATANPEIKDKLRELYKENQELLLIFSSILKSANKKSL